MIKKINYGSQFIDLEDINTVKSSLKNELITSGKLVGSFEKKLSKYTGASHSIVCNSGTSAIYLAMKGVNLQKNDVVIMPAINFISSYNVVKLLGGKPILCDIDHLTGQINHEKIIECIKNNKLKKIKAIILMYNGGYVYDLKKIYNLKKKFKFYLIEDACHALGSSYQNKKNYKIGSCKYSDISTFSLHPLKSITTGEGGVVQTNNNEIYKKILKLRSHGIQRKKNHWDYDVVYNSLNFRLSDINCALGISQLKKLNYFLLKRKKIFHKYIDAFESFKDYIKILYNKNNYKNSYHLVIALINFDNLKIDKDRFLRSLVKKKIFCQYHYIPIYNFSVFEKTVKKKNFKGAEKFYKQAISLPIHVKLTNSQQIYIISSIIRLIDKLKIK